MRYTILIAFATDRELREILVYHRRQISETIAQLLSTEPKKESRSRIKRLRGPTSAVYRLRAGDFRVFYDVKGSTVTILHVRHKNRCAEFYWG